MAEAHDGSRHRIRPPAVVSRLPRYQPWTALAVAAFLIHWAWEMLQAPLYESMRALSFWHATWLCTAASAGDVVLTLLSYGVVAALARSRAWLLRWRRSRIIGYLAVGLAVTAAVEVLSIQHLGRWSYGPTMPRVFGIGAAPLAQWVVVPLVVLWIARHQVGRIVRVPV